MEQQIERADPAARRRALAILLVLAVVGGIVLWLARDGEARLVEWATEDPAVVAERVRLVAIAAALAWLGALLPVSLYLGWMARRVARERRFPPSGVRVVRDTRVIEGEAAAQLALAMNVGNGLIWFAGIGSAAMLWRLAESIAQTAKG